MIELSPCVKCKGKYTPWIDKVDGMYYVRCKCSGWDKNQFLGLRAQYAADQWNQFNRPINRSGNKRREIDE